MLGTVRNSAWQRAVLGPGRMQQQHSAAQPSEWTREPPSRTPSARRPRGESGWKEPRIFQEHSRLRSGLVVEDVPEVLAGLRELLLKKPKLSVSPSERKDHAAMVKLLRARRDEIDDWATLTTFAETRLLKNDWTAFLGLTLLLLRSDRHDDVRLLVLKALEDLPPPNVQGDLVALYAAASTLEDTVALARRLPPAKVHFNTAFEAQFGGTGAPLTVKRAWKLMSREWVQVQTDRPLGAPDEAVSQWSQEKEGRHVRHAILAWGLDCLGEAPQFNWLARRFGTLLSAAPASRDLRSIAMLIETAIEAKDSWLSVVHDDDDKANWNAWTFATLFSSLLAAGQTTLADRVWSMYCDVRGPDRTTDIRVANAILDGHVTRKDWGAVAETWKSIANPDDYTSTTMLVALFRSNDVDGAMRLFAQKRAEKATRVEMCNAVLLGLYLQRRDEQANALFDEMLHSSDLPKPNVTTINTMLRAHGRRKDGARLTAALRTMSDLGLDPDVYTSTTFLDALLRMGHGREALSKVVEIMHQMSARPNAVTLTAMIKVLVSPNEEQDEPANLTAALAVLERMEDTGPRPNEVTYTAVMASLFRHLQGHKVEEQVELALSLLDRMRRLRLEPNRITYHTMLDGLFRSVRLCVDHGKEAAAQQMLERALGLVDEMGREAAEANRPVSRTWILVLDALSELSRSPSRSVSSEARKARARFMGRIKGEHLPSLQDTRVKQRWDHAQDDVKLRRIIDF